jgi:hypothetical protein
MLSIPDTKIKQPPAMIALEAHMLLDNMYSMQTQLTYQIKWLQLAMSLMANFAKTMASSLNCTRN